MVNLTRTGEEIRIVPTLVEAHNCTTPEKKTVTCSAGTSNQINAGISGELGVNLVLLNTLQTSIVSAFGVERSGGETLELELAPPGFIDRYVIEKRFNVINGEIIARSSSDKEVETAFSFDATCSMSIRSHEQVKCGSSPATATPVKKESQPTATADSLSPSPTHWSVAVLSEDASIDRQVWVASERYSDLITSIQPKWDQGYAITEFSYHDGQWIVVMSAGSDRGKQQGYWAIEDLSKMRDWIAAKWDEGFQITEFSRNDDLWLAVMSKEAGLSRQAWKIENSRSGLYGYIQARYDEEQTYHVTELSYANGSWLVVVSQGTGYGAQTVAVKESWEDIKSYIQAHWDEDYYITDFSYADGWWSVVMSKGAYNGRQTWRIRGNWPELEQAISEQYPSLYITSLSR